MVREAELNETDTGLVPSTDGWFVLNAREARWEERPGGGSHLRLTGVDRAHAAELFPMLGMAIRTVAPGEPGTVYHWEREQEDFLVLSGEATLIIEGQERPLKQWDFVHCPPETKHAFVGAGDGPCVMLCVSSRQNRQAETSFVAYFIDELATKHNASPAAETEDTATAFSGFPPSRWIAYREGLLP